MNLCIPNFVGQITKSRTDSRGGGVAFYINNKLDYEVIHNMSFTEKAIETITIKISHKSKSHILVCIYRHPKQNLKLFYELSMSNGLLPKITKPTRVTSITKSLIDNKQKNPQKKPKKTLGNINSLTGRNSEKNELSDQFLISSYQRQK